MKKVLIILSILLFLFSCKSNEENNDGKDYAPFTSRGNIIRWAKNGVIRISLPLTSEGDPKPAGITNYQDGNDLAIKEGINFWSDIFKELNIEIKFVNAASASDIRVMWYDTEIVAKTKISQGIVGTAYYDPRLNPNRGFFIKADSSSRLGAHYSKKFITHVVSHEMGHIFGFWSHSFDKADVMYPFAGTLTALSKRDKETLRHAYSFNSDLNLSAVPENIAGKDIEYKDIFSLSELNTDKNMAVIHCEPEVLYFK